MDLARWQERLAQHFAQLQKARRVDRTERTVYALEHGLGQEEVSALASAIRHHISRASPSMEHTLSWTVYAAEFGYRYSGDQYWQTFEAETPGWLTYGDREWIRYCFRRFHKEFGGVKPTGTWAQQFGIISWPITHAILPQDLQRQLARILYEMRHLFSSTLFESPLNLGEAIESRSWNATSRFQNFAEEKQLVGQIATALLFQGEHGTSNLIYPPTLKRISEDLDEERRAREWLRGARQFASKRVQVRGLDLRRSEISTINRDTREIRAEVAALGIEPRLVLRPSDKEGVTWSVTIELPDLSHLLLKFPHTREILTGSRCLVAGAAGRPLARGRCLHGAQRIPLARWPRNDEVLLQFEQTDPQLDYLLRTECLLRPGPLWLFKIASDGLAYESRSLQVRPGERYILVGPPGLGKNLSHQQPIKLECRDVEGTLIEIPPALTQDWEEALRQLGLIQARTIKV
jgi:hypothetical protein